MVSMVHEPITGLGAELPMVFKGPWSGGQEAIPPDGESIFVFRKCK